jgi:23S rRNA (pseudouridine1915-N3)-methyltransferase
VKNGAQLDQDTLKKKEAELFLQKIEANDQLVLLDEVGKEFTSKAFAGFLQQRLNAGTRSLVFLIGGADDHDPSNGSFVFYRTALPRIHHYSR